MVAMEPGVKRLRAPVPMPWRPWKTAVLEMASVRLQGRTAEAGARGCEADEDLAGVGG